MPFNRSYSTSGSRQRSTSTSGEQLTPDQEGRVNRAYADIERRLAQLGGSAGPGNFAGYMAQVGGALRPIPRVTSDTVYSPEALQAQVNLLRGQNEARAQGQVRTQEEQLAGRGYSPDSPLAMALRAGIMGQSLAASTEAENMLRFDAQRANAEQALQAQSANLQRGVAVNQAEAQRRALALNAQNQAIAADTGRENALLQALAFYNQPRRFSNASSSGQGFSFSSSRSGGGRGSGLSSIDYDY